MISIERYAFYADGLWLLGINGPQVSRQHVQTTDIKQNVNEEAEASSPRTSRRKGTDLEAQFDGPAELALCV